MQREPETVPGSARSQAPALGAAGRPHRLPAHVHPIGLVEMDFRQLFDRPPQRLLPRGVDHVQIVIERRQPSMAGNPNAVLRVNQQVDGRADGDVRANGGVERQQRELGSHLQRGAMSMPRSSTGRPYCTRPAAGRVNPRWPVAGCPADRSGRAPAPRRAPGRPAAGSR